MFKVIKKADIILILVLLLLGIFFYILFSGRALEGEKVVITVDGQVYGSYSLLEDKTIHLEVGNTVVIQDQQVFMKSSTCPGMDCVHQGKTSSPNNPIVCLPHKVIVQVQGESTHADAISK